MTKIYTHQEFKISYSIQGSGPCVIFIHGFCENKTIWEPYVQHFQEHYTTIAFDLPGHGQSNMRGPVHTMETMAQIAKGILDTEGIMKACIIGHSMGGYVGLAFAELFPKAIAGLCLFHSTAHADNEEKKQDRVRAIEVVKKNKGAYVNALIPGIFNPDNLQQMQEKVAWLTDMGLQMPAEGITAALAGMSARTERISVLERATFPISFIIGKRDGILPIASLLPQMAIPKQSQGLILEYVGHAGFAESPRECLFAIEHLLESAQ